MDVACDQAPLPAGATKTVTFEFTATNPVTAQFLPTASARMLDGYGDPKPENNEAQFTVKF
jgi:hypothetical protein